MRRAGIILCVLTLAVPAWAGFVELARSGQWREVLEVARLRVDQLPLSPTEALIAAFAAREQDDGEAEKIFLRHAATDHDLAQVAHIELALNLVSTDPSTAVASVLPTLRDADTSQLREVALDVVERAVEAGIDASTQGKLAKIRPRGTSRQRRRLELVQALGDDQQRRRRLRRIIHSNSSDLEALRAARALAATKLTTTERWLVAKTFYRHALYEEAAPMLEVLAGLTHRSVPSWEVAYLRGRCAFRGGRWAEAIAWYRRAAKKTTSADRRASLRVHVGRSLELAGSLDKAIDEARQAVILKTTDDRRLFLARLRLRNHQPGLAASGISRLRGRQSRARGQLMLALYELRQHREKAALERLAAVDRKPWRAPAALTAAGIELRNERWDRALHHLDRVVSELDVFWAGHARDLMASLPEAVRSRWRQDTISKIGREKGRARSRRVAALAALEIDPTELQRLRLEIEKEKGLSVPSATPAFPDRLAGRLWDLGLEFSAVRWDPKGLPRHDAAAAAWTASRLIDAGAPHLGISAADAAWRSAAAELDVRVLPDTLRQAYHPLPHADLVREAASAHGVPWNLLAGIAREESRWNPIVLSNVGARGLMQLMPATARVTALRLGKVPPDPDELFDPGLSLELGAAELGRLLRVYDGRQAPAIAAYNAGEQQVEQWLLQCGPDCNTESFILGISFAQTRGYTAQVLASADIYSELYENVVNSKSASLPDAPQHRQAKARSHR